MNGAILLYMVSLILGIILTLMTSYYIFLVGIICMLTGYFYTGGKYPIAYSPFGEIVSGLFYGYNYYYASFLFSNGIC